MPDRLYPEIMTSSDMEDGIPFVLERNHSSILQVKSHEMDSLWGPVRNSGGHIITLF